MNKASDNYVAESVLKTLGAETRATPGPAAWADGVAAVQRYLATIGLPAGSYRADNGSGLFSATEVTAHQLVKLLTAAHDDYRIGPDLRVDAPDRGHRRHAREALARPPRARARARQDRHARQGRHDRGVRRDVDSGHPLAFAILVNDVPAGQRGLARAMMDEMVDALAAYLGAS